MSDRALLFLVSAAALIGSLAAAAWLILTGQAGTFDGNFLLLASLIMAAAFGLYLRFMIRSATERPPRPAPPKAAPPAEKKTAVEAETIGKP